MMIGIKVSQIESYGYSYTHNYVHITAWPLAPITCLALYSLRVTAHIAFCQFLYLQCGLLNLLLCNLCINLNVAEETKHDVCHSLNVHDMKQVSKLEEDLCKQRETKIQS